MIIISEICFINKNTILNPLKTCHKINKITICLVYIAQAPSLTGELVHLK